jgi:Spy/CpxP family protein refolding chaperone
MTTRLFFAASLMLAAPLSLTVPVARAQDAPPPAAAPSAPAAGSPSAPGSRGDHPWGPRHDWDRGDRRDGAMERGRGPGGDWARGDGRGDGMPPFGMWWKNPEVATRIGLTAEQQKRIGDLFLQSRVQLIHLHASLEEDQLMLGPLLDATPFDEAKAEAQIDKIADMRAELEKTNAKMLLNIRGVLSADQWTKLRSHEHGMHRPGERDDRGPQGPPRPN